ncbi:serine hydrolase domain-containing protein [Sphingomonas aracearum]|uniref:Class A beta-lactamase-related serine hydrolase n=1 Tax=Sphingomonas aracearum TaxID=2283317 RepID=A0A369VTY2_9SPHN|nr:serine hydrolase domain-containing protein [Sphingomonas aracearum]RDE04532.1 class A beta-lactamase-related serine hydrolase [Sphingomonas aracearum]
MIRALLAAACALAGTPAAAETVDQVAARYRLAGEVLVARGDTVLLDHGYGTIAPTGGAKHKAGERWRLASITKQVTAVAVMRMVAQGRVDLDAPLGPVLGTALLNGVSARMLLTHHSGLANPDDTPKQPNGFAAFYRADRPDASHCLSRAGRPNAPFRYNDCDYLLLGAFLESGEGSEGEQDNALFPGTFAKGSEKGVPGFVRNRPEPAFNLATFGSAGGLVGTARGVFDFDRSLMSGKLLPPEQLKTLWTPEGNGSYQALGAWVFPGELNGCITPKRIMQRDGEIGGVQVRNFLLPDDDLVVVVFTNRSSDDFPIGDVRRRKGFAYDLLSAVACA